VRAQVGLDHLVEHGTRSFDFVFGNLPKIMPLKAQKARKPGWNILLIFFSALLILLVSQPVYAKVPEYNCENYKIEFLGSEFKEGNTNFSYEVCCNGDPAISHWMLILPNVGSLGSIQVNKVVNGPCIEPTEFEVCIDGPLDDSAQQKQCYTFGCDGGEHAFTDLEPGTYTVTEIDPGQDWVVEGSPQSVTVDNCLIKKSDIIRSSHPIEFGLDGSTGLYGIKFDVGIEPGVDGEWNCVIFWFVLSGEWDTGPAQGAVKAGNNDPCIYDVEGPICVNIETATITNSRRELCISGYKKNTKGDLLKDWTIFIDLDDDGVLDDGEPNDKTDENGYWEICGLDVSEQVNVTEVVEPEWEPFDPGSGWQLVTVLKDGNENVNFTNSKITTCISGYKKNTKGDLLKDWTIFIDLDDDGVLDDGEPNDKTDENGYWEICSLDVGEQVNVTEVVRLGCKPFDPASGWQLVMVLKEGNENVNFTNTDTQPQIPLCISGFKNYTDGRMLNGWTIYVDLNKNGILDEGEPFNVTHTDPEYGDGYWKICPLALGIYEVREVPQDGLRQFYPPYLGPHVVQLTEDVINVNFTNGLDEQNGRCISGHKYDSVTGKLLNGWTIFVDNNQNGEFDVNELFNVTYTDPEYGDGYWEICGDGDRLIPGEYTICEVLKEGWTAVDPKSGCQDIILGEGTLTDIDFFNDPRNLTVDKKADKKSVERGEEITYTITVCNLGSQPIHNVEVRDVFKSGYQYLTPIDYDPEPENKSKSETTWTFDQIGAGECMVITLVVEVIEVQDFEFNMAQGVRGEGFVNVANSYSTTYQPRVIKNCVYVTSDETLTMSSCEEVTVEASLGTELETREYGSGIFESEEKVKVLTENKSIEWMEDLSATYNPTTLGLYNNRTVTYDSKWVKKARAKNRITGTSMTETYHDAVYLDRESYMKLDENESMMIVDSEFDGRGHIGFLKLKEPNATSLKICPILKVDEDYVGSFRVYEKISEYGSSAQADKSASGEGFVAAKDCVGIGGCQRSYEYGTGSYESDQMIRTYTNYIAKDISLVYAPANQSLTDDVYLNRSLKWKEGMASKSTAVNSYIAEEYTGIEYLDKETVASGLNRMDTDADFLGKARYRVYLSDYFNNDSVNDSKDGYREPMMDMDEEYVGEYSVQRSILLQGVPVYDRPHMTVTKEGELFYQPEGTFADYTITVENDGSSNLGNDIHIRDIFPPDAVFVQPSSLMPTTLTDTYATWSLAGGLPIGGKSVITLRLNVTEFRGDELVNLVEAVTELDDETLIANNVSAIEINWLKCCPADPVYVTKTARLDANASNVVWYGLDIQNTAKVPRIVKVTDTLPSGMVFIDSSVPFSSYKDNVLTWNLINLDPFETKRFEYQVEALRGGRFVNRAVIEVYSVEGAVPRPRYASAVIEVPDFEGELPAPGWQPPDWDFEYTSYPADLTCEEIANMAPV